MTSFFHSVLLDKFKTFFFLKKNLNHFLGKRSSQKTVIFHDFRKRKRRAIYFDQEIFKNIYKNSEKKILAANFLRLIHFNCNFWNFTNRKYLIFLKFPKISQGNSFFGYNFQISCSESEKHNINHVFFIFSKTIEAAFFSFFEALDISFLRAKIRITNFPKISSSSNIVYFSQNIKNMVNFNLEKKIKTIFGSKVFPESIHLTLGRFSIVQFLSFNSNVNMFQLIFNRYLFFKIFGENTKEVILPPENFLEFLFSFDYNIENGCNFFFRVFYLGKVLRNFEILRTGSDLSETCIGKARVSIFKGTDRKLEAFSDWILKKEKITWVNFSLSENFLLKLTRIRNQILKKNIIFSQSINNNTLSTNNFSFEWTRNQKTIKKKMNRGLGESILLNFCLGFETIKLTSCSFNSKTLFFIFSQFPLYLFEFLGMIRNFKKEVTPTAGLTIFNLLRVHEKIFFI